MTDFKLGQTVWWFYEIWGKWKLASGKIYELRKESLSVFKPRLKIIFEDCGTKYSDSVYTSKEEAIEAMRKWLDGL